MRKLCRLCLMIVPEGEIRNSHIIPRFCFRQQERRVGPSVVVTKRGVMEKSTKQFPEYLLCAACEARMKVGEDYFKTICFDDDGACPIFDMAGYKSSITSLSQKSEPVTRQVPGLDVSRLNYFAASVFWRAAVASELEYAIDDAQRERWRLYLMGQASFPPNAIIEFVVLDQVKSFSDPIADFLDLVNFPWVTGVNRLPSGWEVTRSSFTACGITFRLFWTSQPLPVSPAQPRSVTFTHPLDLQELKGLTEYVHEQSALTQSRNGGQRRQR